MKNIDFFFLDGTGQIQRPDGQSSTAGPTSVNMQDAQKMSHRLRDLFVRKKRHTTQM